MQVFSCVDLNTVQDEEGAWHVTVAAAPGASLSLVQTFDLARILREVAHNPGGMHREAKPDPTFCEEPV